MPCWWSAKVERQNRSAERSTLGDGHRRMCHRTRIQAFHLRAFCQQQGVLFQQKVMLTDASKALC